MKITISEEQLNNAPALWALLAKNLILAWKRQEEAELEKQSDENNA